MFLFKRKKVVLDCFTYNTAAYNLFPIEKSINHLPEWWKKLPSKFQISEELPIDYGSTMKKCAGFVDFYSKGYTIPLWSDLEVNWAIDTVTQLKKFRIQFSDGITKIVGHDPRQRGEYLPRMNYEHIKIEVPWFFDCKKDINWVFVENVWSYDTPENFIVLPGVVNYKYQHTANINIGLSHQHINTNSFTIECGTPIVSLFPLTEDEIEIRNHLVDKTELYDRFYLGSRISFTGYYNKTKKLMREKEKKNKKCPFGFDK